jgi:hypothetical protein
MNVRFAGDSVLGLGFENKPDVDHFLENLKARFSQFGFALVEEKTCVLRPRRCMAHARTRLWLPKALTFCFLGFTRSIGTSRSNA